MRRCSHKILKVILDIVFFLFVVFLVREVTAPYPEIKVFMDVIMAVISVMMIVCYVMYVLYKFKEDFRP